MNYKVLGDSLRKSFLISKKKSVLLTAVATLGLTAASIAQNVPTYIPTNGLVGWWPFNGNANDESGNGNDGTVNGATLSADRNGIYAKAYLFDGNSNHIEIQPSASLNNFNNAITISAWIYCIGQSGNASYGNQDLQGIFGPATYLINDGGFLFRLADPNFDNINNRTINYGNGLPNVTISSSSIVLTNNWENIICSYDGNILKIYRNGVQTDSQIVGGGLTSSLNTAGRYYTIGQCIDWLSPTTNFQSFNGKLDDIAIWNRALTPQEITALYTASPTNNNETSNTTANVPGAIHYQAVARDAQGAPLVDANLQVRFTLIADSLSGTAEYAETHSLTTNSMGLFTTAFGAGTPVSNTFGNINWSAGNKFLKVQIDTGNGLVDIGTQQLLSTPYSMHSATSGTIKNPGLPVFEDNAAALAGGLVAGDMYRTASGDLKIVY
jgi:hypothetical protein